jgi:hypothetical protein
MPDFFSGLTGALTAGRTGQLEGQNQGALENFAIQMQLAQMARAQRAQDIADAAEKARAGYYQNESNRNDTIQRRADALSGIRKATPVDPALTPAAAGLGITLPPNLQESGVGTDTGAVSPVTQLGGGEVYDPTQNINIQRDQGKASAAMDRVNARDQAAADRKNMGPTGVGTSDAKAAAQLYLQGRGIYLKPQVDRISGIYKPPLSPADADRQAKIDVISVYPAEAKRLWGGQSDFADLVSAAIGKRAQSHPAPAGAGGAPFGSVAVPGLPNGGGVAAAAVSSGGARKATGDERQIAAGDPKYKAYLASTGVDVSDIP